MKRKSLKIFCILCAAITWYYSKNLPPVNTVTSPPQALVENQQHKSTVFIDSNNSVKVSLLPLAIEEVGLEKELDVSNLVEKETNIAINYYNEWKNYSKNDSEWKEEGIDTCDTSLPSIEEIHFNNIFWQTIPNTNKTQYFLYNAYYDNRGGYYIKVVANRMDNPSYNLW